MYGVLLEKDILKCVLKKQKKYVEFMFWRCYLYNKKGPFHIQRLETITEKKIIQEDLDRLNKECEAQAKKDQELETVIKHMGLKNPKGKKPIQKFIKKINKMN